LTASGNTPFQAVPQVIPLQKRHNTQACMRDVASKPHFLIRTQSCRQDWSIVTIRRIQILTGVLRLLAFALSPDPTHYPQYRSIQFTRKDFGGVVQRSYLGR
jgi:hypothetical protein